MMYLCESLDYTRITTQFTIIRNMYQIICFVKIVETHYEMSDAVGKRKSTFYGPKNDSG